MFDKLLKQMVKDDIQYQKESHERFLKEQEEKKKREAEQRELEEMERLQYRQELEDDPTSVMICPFGWSPFGIYL